MIVTQRWLVRGTYFVFLASFAPKILMAALVFGRFGRFVLIGGGLWMVALFTISFVALERLEKGKIRNRVLGWGICVLHFGTSTLVILTALDFENVAWILATPETIGLVLTLIGLGQSVVRRSKLPNKPSEVTADAAPPL